MQAHGEELMDKPMPAADEELFALYETTGNRLKYESVYFARRKMLAVYGCLSLMEGKPEYLKKLEEVLDGICEEECCNYSVVATVAGVATVGVTSINNATLSAIVVDNGCGCK